ncbi:hypothetical protein B7463_g1312, partial [Scytalidium lignicola]
MPSRDKFWPEKIVPANATSQNRPPDLRKPRQRAHSEGFSSDAQGQHQSKMPSSVITTPANHDGPVVKRQKLDGAETSKSSARESRIFTPFRTIGLVSPTSVPFTSVPLGKTTFQITTSAGSCLQTYDLKRGLNLVFLTRPQTPEDITATVAWKDRVFAAWGGSGDTGAQGLWVFKRGKKCEELKLPADLHQPIQQLLVFGSWIVGCCLTRIEVWKSTTYEHYTTLYTTAAPKNGNRLTGGICTMPTYLNKIFVGRKDGIVEIWNVSSGKLVYSIMPAEANCGAVTALQPTPALSLLAIAYAEGPLTIHDVRTDKSIIHLNSGLSKSEITTISFRTDDLGAGEDGRRPGVMATAGRENGDVTFWDLNRGGRIMGVLRGAHNPPLQKDITVGGGISKVEFLPGQPVIITSGLDNSLKSWIFNETPYSPIPRLLHSRSGHAAPATKLQFLPSDFDGAEGGGKWLLSAGKDRSLWGWSLRRDGQSTELSQGHIRKKAKKLGILANASLVNEPSTSLEDLKAPEITCIASSLNRDGGMGAHAGTGKIWQKGSSGNKKQSDSTLSANTGWESVVTGHKDDKYARTWFWGRKRAGRWAFETGDGSNVRSVAISPCGTFAIVGSENGGIDMFNLQSGLHRQRYPSRLTPAQARKLKLQQLNAEEGGLINDTKGPKGFQPGRGKHIKAVTGVVIDSMNKNVISCSLDGKIKFWDFGTGNLVDEIDWHPMTAITELRYHAPSDLIALACDDSSIRVVDIETKKTIRELWGCQSAINDLCFSNDGRWIIAASADRVVRVWDLPTGHLIDAIRMETPCTALAFSSTGEFLATTCEGQVGVSIWNNKTLFTHIPTRHISEDEIVEISRPTVSGEGGHNLIDGAFEEQEAEEDAGVAPTLDQLSSDLMTLSLVPKSRWQTLVHLDLIKQRNKPKEAPKAPEKAPFFLPSLEHPSPLPKTVDDVAPSDNAAERSRIMKLDRVTSEGEFTVVLRTGRETGDFTPFIEHLKTLSPAAADLEIRSLNPGQGDEESDELVNFVHALTSSLVQKRNYELVQAWMTVFLRLHADSIAHDERLIEALRVWREHQNVEAARMGDLVGYCSGVRAAPFFVRLTIQDARAVDASFVSLPSLPSFPTLVVHQELDYLPNLLKEHNLGPNITFASRRISHHPRANHRLPITEVDQELIPFFTKFNLDHDTSLPLSTSSSIELEVTRSPRPGQIDATALLFGVSTTFKRFNDSLTSPVKEWKRWLTDENGRSNGAGLVLCLFEPTNDELRYAARVLLDAGIDATVQPSDPELDMAGRYVDLVGILHKHPTAPYRKYLALIDDDTFFPSMSGLLSLLSLYDPSKPYYIGSMTERADWMLSHRTPMAYGGAGIFFTQSAARRIIELHCLDVNSSGEYLVPGDQGDLLLYNCLHNRSDLVLTHVPQLHQLDHWGDPSGFYESGQQPLSLHHFKSWHLVAPDQMHVVAESCGEDCFMQRFQFRDNWIISNGYSVVHYPQGIDFDPLQMEGTFSTGFDRESVEDLSLSYSFGPLRRSLSETGKKKSWELLDARNLGNGVVYQTYVKHRDDKRWLKKDEQPAEADSVIVLAWV